MFSADEDTPLLTIAATVAERLKDISENVQLDGCDVTIIVTKKDLDDLITHAVLSTIDDHDELLETLDVVLDDCLEPYREDSDDDQPELPFEKVTLQ